MSVQEQNKTQIYYYVSQIVLHTYLEKEKLVLQLCWLVFK